MLGSIAVNCIGESQRRTVALGFVCPARRCAQFGAISSPASQPAAVGVMGSDAMTLISTRSHLGHSNNWCSKPIGPAETRSSIIRVWQREQQGRSMQVKNCGIRPRHSPFMKAGALPDGCLGRSGDKLITLIASKLNIKFGLQRSEKLGVREFAAGA
jgi:hypothetical protein